MSMAGVWGVFIGSIPRRHLMGAYWGGLRNITVFGVGRQSGQESGRRIFAIYGNHGAIFGTIVVGYTTGIYFGDHFGLKLEFKVILSAAFFCRRLYELTWAGLES
ncbi:hypothetical protein P3342_011129 [Pyrenophora teres f. teres]|nr:hypothetical protein P3342_011129 [Pyrenophora teres f. teres]